jgi:hypothetical protein
VVNLKFDKVFIVFTVVFFVLMVGCSNGIKNEGNKIVVEKRIGETDKYEYYNEIKNSKEVEKVKDILNSISWENAEVDMAYPPQYKFYFENTNEEKKSNEITYELWISPNKDKIELIIDSESKYIQLNKEKSVELFKMITGRKLNES